MTRPNVLIVEADPRRSSELLEMLAASGIHAPTLMRAGDEALRCVSVIQPDVFIISLELPGLGGLHTAEGVKRACDAGVVLTGGALQAESLSWMRANGAHYLAWPLHPQQLAATVRLAAREGERDDDRTGSGTFALKLDANPGLKVLLSSREMEVYLRLVRGERVADIAKALFISPHTARKHTKAIFRKLNVHSHVELMRRSASEE